jgi:molybdopterin synthase sulfur carrier subunit
MCLLGSPLAIGRDEQEYPAMATTDRMPDEHETALTVVSVRFWAAARAAAGTSEVAVETSVPLTLAELVERVTAGRPERLGAVLAGCSVLLGDQPVSTRDPADVLVAPGQTVEFLPPFAGG